MLIPYGKHGFIRLVFNDVYALRAIGNWELETNYCYNDIPDVVVIITRRMQIALPLCGAPCNDGRGYIRPKKRLKNSPEFIEEFAL